MADSVSLLGRLIAHGVDFVVVGGFAAVAHGVTLLTQDIDVCCDYSPDNLLRLQEALKDLNPVHRMTPNRIPLDLTPATCRELKNLYLDTDLGQLDCLGEVSGVGPFAEVKAASIEVNLGGRKCLILSIEALIAAKQAMGRPRDAETILQLRAIQERERSMDPRDDS